LIEAGAPLVGTELHFPIYCRDVEMVSLLIAQGSPVDLPLSKNEEYGPKKGDTPLATLLRFNNFDLAGGSFDYEVTDPARLELCSLLLKHGANPNQPVAKGITPLRLVLPKTHDPFNLQMTRLLVEAGANPHSVPPGSKEPSVADLAVERGLTEFVELFASVAEGGNR
jgi:ankyrin repeat protein